MAEGRTRAVASAAREANGALVERSRELGIVVDALTGAAAKRSSLLVVEGPAGIGKTRLLAEGRRLASDAGVRVLAARASELERELAFGVVRQLFEDVFDAEVAGPAAGAAAAARAVLNAAPRDASEAGSADASFAMLHSLYWLTVTLATTAPLAITVDDLHLCDEPSLRFLNYLIRRLEGLGVGVLCTLRPRERRARASLVSEIVSDPIAISIRPRPLSPTATAQLLGDGLGELPSETFAAACHTASGGNPLLLRELISTLQLEGVRPDSEHVSAVADLGPGAVSRAVLVRLARLSDDALRLARAASIVTATSDLAFLAQLAELGPDRAASAASSLVSAEILSNETEAGFVHPLVGAAVYADMPALDRALGHERAARLLRERGSPARTVAVHLALAPSRGHDWVCDVLEEAARGSLRAGAPESAVHYLARALAEPVPQARRSRLLFDLGTAEAMLDSESALEHLRAAFEQDGDTAVRDAAAVALARMLLFLARPDDCVALINRARALMAPGSDLGLALEALQLMASSFGIGEPLPLERLERRLAPDAGPGGRMLAAVVSRQWAFAGGTAEECAQLALDALGGGELIAADDSFLSVTAILTLVRADRPEADEQWKALLQQSRVRGSLAAKAGSSLWRGYTALRRGELDDAQELLQSAREEFRLLGSAAPTVVHHAAFASAVLRERGDLADAERALRQVELPNDTSDGARYWLDAYAELLLVEERFDEAYLVASDMERRFAFIANPVDTPARSHRAIALYHLGRVAEGLALAAESLELARRWGAPGGLARALRVLGTLEREEGLDHLRQAVEVAERSLARLEHAKALGALGTSLRRARRPSEAREPLRRAMELAERLGAAALGARIRHELRATGARPRTTTLTGPDALTPAERRVAERAAAGQTNRAIAEALFVTTKTVELHLRNAYRKLGVRSRVELAGAFDPVARTS